MSETKIIAIANQKGGVGKTTTAINLGAALIEKGMRVVLIDLDPQGNASTGLGVAERGTSSYDLLLEKQDIADCAQKTESGMMVVPASSDLSSADIELSASHGRTQMLRQKLRDYDGADYILIDCPPALGLLTLNAMVAADSVLVPLQAEFFALEGLSQLLLTVREVRQSANPDLRIEGVVLTMADGRNNLSQQVEADARATLGEMVFQTVIPRNVRLSEAPSFAQPIFTYDPASKGSAAYRALCEELLRKQ